MISTKEFAARHQVKPESVASRLCREGSYFGIKPEKLCNGRLVWPDVSVATPAEPSCKRFFDDGV